MSSCYDNDLLFQTDLSFGREYTAAVESKQVAQQEAQRAQFFVEKSKQERQEKMVRAEGEAQAALMISSSLSFSLSLPLS